MALTPEEIQRLIQAGAISPETGSLMQPAPVMRFDPSRAIGTGDAPPSVPPPVAPTTPGTLGTGQGAALAQQLMGQVKAQAGAPETITAPVGALARPYAPPQPVAPPLQTQAAPSAAPKGNSLMKSFADYRTAALGNLDEQARNVEAQRDFDQRQAVNQAIGLQQANEELMAADAQRQAEHAHRTQVAEAAVKDLESRSAEIASFREDPNRLWHSMSTGQQILAGVSLLASAIGGPQTSQQAMGVLQRGIDRDVEAQRSTWQAKKDSFAARQTAFGRMMDLYRDEDSAAAALRTLQLDQAARKLQLMAAGSQSEAVQLRAQQALTALKAQRDQAAFQFARQQYSMAAGPQVPAALKQIYGDAGTAKQAYAEWLRANPSGRYEEFVSQSVAASKGKLEVGGPTGDVKVSPRLQGMLVKDETINATAEETARQFDLVRGPDGKWVPRGALSAIATWGGNAIGDLFGTQAAATRQTTNETLVDERASAAAQGKPDAETMAEYRHQQNTNNPWKVAGLLNESERAGAAQKKAILETARHSKVTSARDDDDDERGR